MRILITGANGFLGRRVIEALGSTAAEVHAVSRHQRSLAAVKWHTADLLDRAQRRQLITAVGPTHLIHLAWTTEHGQFWNSPRNVAWGEATLDLLEHFAAAGGQRAVAAGSCAEYDWTAPQLASGKCNESSTPLAPATVYGQAKLATFQQATELAAALEFEMVWARFFFLYGVEEHPDRLVPALIRAALTDAALELKHPNRVLDFMSTAEAAEAVVAVVASGLTGPVNIATGHGVRISALAQLVRRLTAGTTPIESEADVGGATSDVRLVADTTRLSTEVGFDPKYDIESSLARAIEWWSQRLDHPTTSSTDPETQSAK